MRVTVLGAGSWGTTVASLLCRRDHEVLLWARNPEVAAEVDGQRSNEAYLPGVRLPARLSRRFANSYSKVRTEKDARENG